jgi:hypothetical protein
MKLVEGGAIFDVALVDTTLPGMDGWELLGRLRSHPSMATRPIALMAGILEDVALARIEKAPIQAFLRKPVDLRDLADKMAALIAVHHVSPDPSPQQAESAPSDLLILEEQDLAHEISLAEPSWTAAETDAPEAEGPPEEDTISIDLEDLDISKIDQLVAGDGQPSGVEDEPPKDPAVFLDTAPGDFGPELLSAAGQAGRRSPIANELLSDPEFIRAIAKEVEKNISLRGIDV